MLQPSHHLPHLTPYTTRHVLCNSNDVRHVLGGNAANDGNNDGTYFQGFGLYVLLSIILAALATLCGCCFCIGRAWCCCCRHGTCGKRVPTKAAWCCPGYRVRTIK